MPANNHIYTTSVNYLVLMTIPSILMIILQSRIPTDRRYVDWNLAGTKYIDIYLGCIAATMVYTIVNTAIYCRRVMSRSKF